jgi:ribosomal protein S18 acetylase RimI-like enzyme
MTNDIRPTTKADSAAVARTLAAAFADDPVMSFLSGGRNLTSTELAPFFKVFQTVHLDDGHVYTTPNHEAAAIWAPPDRWKVPVSQIARHSATFVKLYGKRLVPNLRVLNELEKRHPTAPHYHLAFIGAAPIHQGQGFASKLIRPMVERADMEGVGMYLENSKEANVGFYARFGFEVRDTMTLRPDGPPLWLMWRDPILG